MISFKSVVKKFLSIGVRPDQSEGKKIALQIAAFDGYWTLLTLVFYSLYHTYYNYFPLNLLHILGAFLVGIGLYFVSIGRYDSGRYIIHLTGLSQIFVTVDAVGTNAGAEFYYFTSFTIPIITFSLEEQWKGAILSLIAATALITQHILGPGLFLPHIDIGPDDTLLAIIVVICFLAAVFVVARWQLFLAQKEVKRHQSEIVHSSNLIALGEMSSGIAHEINNPLQALTLQVSLLRRYLKTGTSSDDKLKTHLDRIDETIFKMAKMVNGLKDLSRDTTQDPPEIFSISKVIDDVMSVSAERIRKLGIGIEFRGNLDTKILGHSVQLGQVLVNLLNNSIYAISEKKEKWISVSVVTKSPLVEISVTDSGEGIPPKIAEKMMNPFFTTKEPSKGTGLGLSISSSLMERNGGKLYYDSASRNTRFVMALPAFSAFSSSRVRDFHSEHAPTH